MTTSYREWMLEMLANANSKNYNYLISHHKNRHQYFYYNFDEYEGYTKPNIVRLIWTPQQSQAFIFSSEQEVEEFKADFISPRKASIVRVVKTPQTLLELLG